MSVRDLLTITSAACFAVLAACSGSDEPAPDVPAAETAEAPQPPALGPADGHDLPAEDLERIQLGDVAPDFTLASYDDGVLSLSDFRGSKNIVLVFYRGYW